ncbi:C2H2-type domain-containing protein [Abeliophyllum distichum]|uniref:C2H2-type domain-containing protein n=1 Tax=Abeliophyllum distichum TaxID=126358 RepID=A0ABD1Q838_9LAMI
MHQKKDSHRGASSENVTCSNVPYTACFLEAITSSFICYCRRGHSSSSELDGLVKSLPVVEDLPGMSQHHCLHCDWHPVNVAARDEHSRLKSIRGDLCSDMTFSNSIQNTRRCIDL